MMSEEVSTLAALNRPFSLGMLYDCRSDQLVPGVTLWNSDSLQKNVTVQPQENSNVKILTSDTIQSKMESLNVHGGLKLSIMGGLFTVSGSGEYLNDHQNTSEVARVTLKYKTTSHFKQLSMDHLATENITYPTVFDQQTATHVVSGIEYGCDAYFVFEKNVDKNQTKRKIQGDLAGTLETLATKISVTAGAKFDELKQKYTENISCTFYGDFRPDFIPTSYSDAIKVIEQFPVQLNSIEAVPKVVHLYPLVKLDSKAARHVRDISEKLVDEVQNCFQILANLKGNLASLKKQRSASSEVPFLMDELAEFNRVIDLTTAHMQKSLLPILPRIRGGGAEETDLAQLLETWKKSAYDPSNTAAVMKKVEQNVAFINTYIKTCEKKNIKVVFNGDLEEILADLDTQKAVCFTLNSEILENRGLKTIRRHLNADSQTIFEKEREWFDEEKEKTVFQESFRLFITYAELNQSSEEGVVYLLTENNGESIPKAGFVRVCKDGGNEIIDLPSHPEGFNEPTDGDIFTTSAWLRWKEPKQGKDAIQGYKLVLRESGDVNVEERDVMGSLTEAFMEGLKQGHKYKCTVQAISVAGLSHCSDLIEIKLKIQDRLAVKILARSKPVPDKQENLEIYCPRDKVGNTNDPVRRFGIGLPRQGLSTEKSILVVGATGTGKTTFLNALTNYLFDVHQSDNFRFKIITQEDEGKESAKSVTKHVSAYLLRESRKNYTLTVLDTPGYGDTEGLAADKNTTNLIKELFERKGNGVDRLDAICIVVKATDTRLTAQQRHNFNSVLSLFGNDVKNNIIVVATFADASEPPVKLALKEAQIPYTKLFTFNNSAIFEKITDENQRSHEFYWEIAQDNFKQFFEYIETLKPVSLSLTSKVLTFREQLENYVVCLQNLVQEGRSLLSEMRQEYFILQEHAADIDRNNHFIYTVTQQVADKKYVKVQEGQYFTTCLPCNRTCHDNCIIADDDRKKGCSAMKSDGYCKICEAAGKTCFWDLHRNQPFIWVYRQETVQKTDEDLRNKYTNAEECFKTKDSMLEELGRQFASTEMKIQDMITNINSALTELKNIALKPDPLTDEDYINVLIEAEKSDHNPGWEDRVAGLQHQKKKLQSS